MKDSESNIQRSSEKIQSLLIEHFSAVSGHGAAIPEIHDIGIDRAREFQYITPTKVKEAATKCSVHKAHPAGDVFPTMY